MQRLAELPAQCTPRWLAPLRLSGGPPCPLAPLAPPCVLAPAAAAAARRLAEPPAVLGPQRRHFANISDSPFRWIKPMQVKEKIRAKKKHYNEVLVMADIRKLMETTQQVMSQKTPPRAFWEILAKRCHQSMHLLKPLELALIARAFDMHNVKLKPWLDIYRPIAQQVLAQTEHRCPGLAVVALADVLPRRLAGEQAELTALMKRLGRQAADAMYELSASQAVRVLKAMADNGVQDAPLCSRVAHKIASQLQVPGGLSLQDLASAASVLAQQEHRNLPVLLGIAEATAALYDSEVAYGSASQAPLVVLDALERLDIDAVPESLALAARRAAETPPPDVGGGGTPELAAEAPGDDSSAAFSLEDLPPERGQPPRR